MRHGNTWRIHRRLFHRFFNAAVVDQFDDKIHRAVNVFLHRLSESPEHLFKHADLYVDLHPIQSLHRLGLTTHPLTGQPHPVFDLVDYLWAECRV